ncbi:Rv1355c family protein [Streptomyces sp. T-3]|nr:Rv1355c family protein [Streptomyces sp. T-3]
MNLDARIDSLARSTTKDGADPHQQRPSLFSLLREADRAALDGLLAEGQVLAARDTLTKQLAELLTSRRPDWHPDESELTAAVADHLEGRPVREYGTWVWYPWSRQLVHLLPAAEFRELRQSRNRYKITAEEQALLAQRTIAVIGLSVGAASAVTLAQEGVGTRFRLADFDRLDLSNLNRLRASVADIGLPKVTIAARQMYEIDPYLDIEVWPGGLTEDNVDEFLTVGRRADLLVEECDDLYIKVYARERARAHGIAVLMETNERGMLDVERFDLEPDRPLLHGLLDDVSAADLKGLSTRDKVPHVLRIVRQDQPSERFVPSLVEIGHTISSWPQLASGVALGAALVTDAARRMLLGTFTASGRFFVDPGELVRDGSQVPLQPVRHTPAPEPELPRAPLVLPERGRPVDRESIRRLVAYGIQAPSGGNSQPWQFVWRDNVLECRADDAPTTLLDFDRSATHLALGAAVENIELAARAAGLSCRAHPFPRPGDPSLVCALTFRPDEDAPRPSLADWIERRATNRRPGPDRPLSHTDAEALTRCARDDGAHLHLVTDRDQLDEVGRIIGAGDRLRMLSRQLHQEMMSELRWDGEQARRTRDGIDIDTLELDSTDRSAMAIARHWANLSFLQRIGGGAAFEDGARKLVAASSAVGCLTIPGVTPDAYLHGGRVLQRLWLTAASLGVALQPLSVLPYLFARVERGGGAGLDPAQTVTLRDLRGRFDRVIPRRPGEAEVLLFRLSYAPPPTALSLRRDPDSVLRFG